MPFVDMVTFTWSFEYIKRYICAPINAKTQKERFQWTDMECMGLVISAAHYVGHC